MKRVSDTSKGGIAFDLLLVWGEIAGGVTAQTSITREKYWSHWRFYCNQCGTDPYMQSVNPCEQAIIISAFSARVRTGAYVHGN